MDYSTLKTLRQTLEEALLLVDQAMPEAQAAAETYAEERERRRVENRDRPKVLTGIRGSTGGATPVGGSEAPRA